ncbi:hypothetical protein FEM48_Zijuj10G0133100 [Ziziphus jujuba var. spinosa]|uniref:Uncharacterized protein n=1 Tax=Ziziphus jujuba var. spinosa TaxID=714518 RepID=A0A978UNL5_ZIZJJ|nr:hypothetical protein FEM48_Zijuj10G0133100 [Ziziphus jujuba var. spinosa]
MIGILSYKFQLNTFSYILTGIFSPGIACDAIVVWSPAPCRSHGNMFRFDLQNTLQKLPNNIFERSYSLREFDLQKRLHSFFYKTAELCMAGLTAGAVQGYLCQYLVQALMHLVMVAFLGLYANMRCQLLCGYDRAMFNHVDVIRGALFFSIALKFFSMKHLLAAYICYICETFKLVISEFIYRTLKRIAITRCYLGSPNMKRRIDNHQPSLNGEHNRPPV